MSWEKGESEVVFFCDGPDCEVTDLFNIAETRIITSSAPSSSDFAVCWGRAQGVGWRSFKKGGRPWEYFCAKCAPAAEEAQRRHNELENERERIRQRNARN